MHQFVYRGHSRGTGCYDAVRVEISGKIQITALLHTWAEQQMANVEAGWEV